jgi:hypothetical protein
MGVVWRARDDVLGVDVALKFIPDAVRWDPAAYEDLKAETRRARQLTHPNIVRVHDFVEDGDSAAISMELVEGETLTVVRLRRENKFLEPADLAPWLPQLASALDYAHGEGRVVHRDLKPSNLMITGDGRLKVTDFGVARGLADSVPRVSMMSAGTLVYMSPQQAMGEDPAPSDDIYSLGATLYELLTGKPPFHTGDVRMQLFQRRPDSLSERRNRLGAGNAPVPPVWEETIAACLAKEPGDRPASVGEVAQRIGGNPAKSRQALRWRPTRRLIARTVAACALGAAMFAILDFGFPGRSKPVAPTVAVFPSDSTRALAAWDFDGDARDGSGRGLDCSVSRAMATRDRFGRIDRALYFNGSANVVFPDAPALRWGGRQPFTAAIWVRQDESATLSGSFWNSVSKEVNALLWWIGFTSGRPHAALYRQQIEEGVVLKATDRAEVGSWHHLALVSDGSVARFFVDGRLNAQAPLGTVAEAAVPSAIDMRIGVTEKGAAWGLTGAIDDARVWRRSLSAEEVAALAYREPRPRVRLSAGAYGSTGDLSAAVRAEFGEEARLVDWTDLKRWWADGPRTAARDIGPLTGTTLGWVQRNGQCTFEKQRCYFVDRFDGVKPDYYMVHDEIGGMTFALGSWHGSQMPLLAALPPAEIRVEKLQPDPGGNVIRREGSLGRHRAAAALLWRARLQTQDEETVAVRVRLVDSRLFQAVCEIKQGSIALALGPVEGGGIANSVPGRFGDHDFTFVVRDRHLSFRAASAVGANPVFERSLAVVDFRLADIAAIEVAGGPQARLTGAELVIE